MIIRAALSFGLVWLLMAHAPDLGLTPAKAACAACQTLAGSAARSQTLARLAEVKIELRQAASQRHDVVVAGASEAVQRISDRLAVAAFNQRSAP